MADITIAESIVERLAAHGVRYIFGVPGGDCNLDIIDAGARHDLRGAFQETALHWSAFVGLPRLSSRLIAEGADVNLKDARYNASPLGWAVHGWRNAKPDRQPKHCEVAAMLVAAGASIDPAWLTEPQILADPAILSALQPGRP